MLSMSSVITRRKNLVEAEVDDEIVALDIDTGSCYGLNKVGRKIWMLISEPRSVGDVCALLAAEYDVDRETCERDVIDLLEELRRENLIETTDSAA